MAEPTTTTSPAPRQGLLARVAHAGRNRASRRTERRTARKDRRAGPQTSSPEDRIAPVAEATQTLEDVGQESIQGERDLQAENLADAQDKEKEQELGQAGTQEKFDEADTAAQEGLEDIQGEISDTRDLVESLPADVKGAFADAKADLDASFEQARTGLEGKSSAAQADVMTGRAGAMEASTAAIHGATREQMSNIDAQVQQGTLSPSQATAMKAKIRMGASMQLSAAVGQTVHMFAQTQAKLAADFGSMFTSFENMAGQVEGQFGATAAGAFGAAELAKADFNRVLIDTDAKAVAHRDTMLSNDAAARAAANNMDDMAGIAMMDYTQPMYISEYPMAVNQLTAMTDLANMGIRLEEMEVVVSMMERSAKTEKLKGLLDVFGTAIQLFTGG